MGFKFFQKVINLAENFGKISYGAVLFWIFCFRTKSLEQLPILGNFSYPELALI